MSLLFRDAAGPSLAPGGSVVCVGAFDGVHRGHRALFDRVAARARARGLAACAISFEPIPREFFARGTPVPRLASVREKIERIGEAGIERLLLLRFNAALAAMQAEDFVARVLHDRCGAREIWVGADFRFGHARRGDVALLKTLGVREGFVVETLPDVAIDGERVSSSAIRAHLAAGEFDAAARLLGRAFSIGGHVVHGLQLGRKLGYPTANIRLGRRVSPVGGIFAVRVHGIESHPLPGVASLGIRPTIDGTEPLLEAHVFDFDGDLYGRRLDIEFVAKLRDEAKFADLGAMVKQIDLDAAEARAILRVDPAFRHPGESRDPFSVFEQDPHGFRLSPE
ncbi:MAG TPA: bifunctional riboflavin kinase/FAD synthetase [Rhodanobacteraceae bacterium]|nr:bifunctional riboflavin kinase/FAD synthetase [Rhodanobacteraceae bacterium]